MMKAVGVNLADFLQEVEPVHLGHHEIRQDDVEAVLPAELHRHARVLRRFDFEIEGLHVAAENLENARVIVDNQGFVFLFSWPTHGNLLPMQKAYAISPAEHEEIYLFLQAVRRSGSRQSPGKRTECRHDVGFMTSAAALSRSGSTRLIE